jgi:hypothetical protein
MQAIESSAIVSIFFTASEISTGLQFGGIKRPVFPSMILSLSHPSFTAITGVPQAIDSTGLIPKSSSTGT